MNKIESEMEKEFTTMKAKYVEEEEKRITENYKATLSNQTVKLKIEKSKQQNMARIERMRKVNEYVDQLRQEMKQQVRDKLKNDQAAYKDLIKNLLIQGLIKLMEGNIFVRCRESDVAVIESIKDEAIAEYKNLVVTQVKRFEGKDPNDIPCNIIIDGKRLESIEDNELTGSVGGFKLYAKKGRIVCSQTIDDRIELVFGSAIPAIRHELFPSMRRPERKVATE